MSGLPGTIPLHHGKKGSANDPPSRQTGADRPLSEAGQVGQGEGSTQEPHGTDGRLVRLERSSWVQKGTLAWPQPDAHSGPVDRDDAKLPDLDQKPRIPARKDSKATLVHLHSTSQADDDHAHAFEHHTNRPRVRVVP